MNFLKFIPLFVALIILAGCAGSSNGDDLEVPTYLPPICRDIDFVANPEMREMCGVRRVHINASRYIPQQRYLINPNGTSIVKTDGQLELRFQNSLPLYLDGPITRELQFNQEKRLEKVQNSYDYHEIYSGKERIRIFKMGIPTDMGYTYDFCFRIPEKKGNARTRSVAMGNHIEAMTCDDFDFLVTQDNERKAAKK